MMRLINLLSFTVCVLGLAAQQPAASRPALASLQFEISGRVVDAASGAPLSHTVVAIAPVSKRDNVHTMSTDGDGQFRFTDLPADKYTLTAQRRGYITESYEQHDQYSTSIAVGPDLDSTGIVFRVHPDGAIYGRVTDDHNEPVANAQVLIFRNGLIGGKQGTDLQRRLVTTDEGLFRFSHVPPGKYYLVVSGSPWYAHGSPFNITGQARPAATNASGTMVLAQSPKPASDNQETRSPLDVAFPITFYPGVLDLAVATPIVLPPGGRFAAEITLQAVPALHVRLNINEPTRDRTFTANLTHVVADNVTIGMGYLTFTAIDNNTVELTGVAPGSYNLDVNTQRGGVSSQSTRAVELTRNITVGPDEIPLSAPVSGIVGFDDGSALPGGGFIQLRNQKTRQVLVGQISAQGEFELKQAVPAGSYDVAVNGIASVFLKSMAANGAKVSGQSVTIAGSGPVKMAVMLTKGLGRIDGKALRDDKPVAGVMIVLVPQDPANNATLFRRDQSDSDGSFSLATVIPGKYTILAIENGWEMEWANPAVLKPYMAQGEPLQIQANGKYQAKLKVQ
jgi:carboxypeptidase family protein